MRYTGPIGAREEGSGAASGPSSRSPRKRAAVERLTEHEPLPTTEQLQAAQRRTERSGSGIYEYWLNAMRGPLHGKSSSASTERKRFAANVRHLLDTEGIDKATLQSKIDEFARRVGTGSIDVHMKQPWSIFMGMWSKLGGSASSEGLDKKMASRSREDWV